MNITIEQNKVVVNLDPDEFKKFEKMFANLNVMKNVRIEMRDFPTGNAKFNQPILPMHLCRTIGEANLSEDPFATISLYPFWKYGFAFGECANLSIDLSAGATRLVSQNKEGNALDPHKKASAADDIAMGICVWSAEEIFKCVEWADTSALLRQGAIFPLGSKRPDFVCTFPDNTLGIFEAKGTTGGSINQALAEGKIQTAGITAPVQIKYRVVVGAIIGEPTKIILLDPPEPVGARHAVPVTNLTPDLVAKAAKAMRTVPVGAPLVGARGREGTRPSPTNIATAQTETIFRSVLGEIKLTTEFKEDKKHNWLEVK
jgi:hypothetical protein